MIVNHFLYIQEDIKAPGLPALSVIQIPPTIPSSHVSLAMSIIRLPWMKNTGKRVDIHITAQHAFIVIPGEWQMINNF
jgi:hypothetical protein